MDGKDLEHSEHLPRRTKKRWPKLEARAVHVRRSHPTSKLAVQASFELLGMDLDSRRGVANVSFANLTDLLNKGRSLEAALNSSHYSPFPVEARQARRFSLF